MDGDSGEHRRPELGHGSVAEAAKFGGSPGSIPPAQTAPPGKLAACPTNRRRALITELLIAAGCVAVAAAGVSWIGTSMSAAPWAEPQATLWLPSCPLHLGSGRPGGELEGSFPIRNTGTAPLTFKIRSGCGCTYIEPSSGMLDPKSEKMVHIRLRLPREGGNRGVRLELVSTDGSFAPQGYSVSGECRAPLRAVPEVIHFGSALPGGFSPQPVTLRGVDGSPLASGEEVEVHVEGADYLVQREPSASKAAFSITPGRTLPVGNHRATISFTHSRSGEKAVVDASAWVSEEICLVPNSIEVTSSELGNRWERVVLAWRADESRLGTLVSVKGAAGLSVRDAGAGGGGRRRLIVSGDSSVLFTDEESLELIFEGTETVRRLRVSMPQLGGNTSSDG